LEPLRKRVSKCKKCSSFPVRILKWHRNKHGFETGEPVGNAVSPRPENKVFVSEGSMLGVWPPDLESKLLFNLPAGWDDTSSG